MARIQVLTLPVVKDSEGGERTPFVLVIDQASDSLHRAVLDLDAHLRAATGACAVLTSDETLDLPASRPQAGGSYRVADMRMADEVMNRHRVPAAQPSPRERYRAWVEKMREAAQTYEEESVGGTSACGYVTVGIDGASEKPAAVFASCTLNRNHTARHVLRIEGEPEPRSARGMSFDTNRQCGRSILRMSTGAVRRYRCANFYGHAGRCVYTPAVD